MSKRLHRLANGMLVLCDPAPGLETIAVSLVVRGGARWEPQGRCGWSHLLEHMVFKGAGERSAQEIVETVEAAGAQINAATSHERTSFQVRSLKDRLPLALEVLSDLTLRPTFRPDELEREVEVIGQEIAEAFDTPDDHVFEMAQAEAFSGQPLGRPILGEVASIAVADGKTLEDWRARLYAPERMCLSVAGAVDEAELLRLAESWFGGERSRSSTSVTPEPAPGVFRGGHARLSRRIEQANLVWQLPAPAASAPERYAARLFVEILGGGMASRLFQQAREQRGLAYTIDAWITSYEDCGVLGVFAGAAADKAVDLGRLVAEQIRALADDVTEAELGRAKAQFQTALFMGEESLMSRAERNASQTFLFGAPLPAQAVRQTLEAVSREDLKQVAQSLLAHRRSATAVLGPRAAHGAGRAFEQAIFN